MKWRSREHENLEVNVTPLIDVVFLLLIFFMVTTSFEKKSRVQIDLPHASIKAQEQLDEPLSLTIDRDGSFYVNDQRVASAGGINALRAAIKKAVHGQNNPPVILQGDAKAELQAMITAMDALRQLGLGRVSIRTRLSTP